MNSQPIIHDCPAPGQLNTSMLDWYDTVLKGPKNKDAPSLATLGAEYVDVRDLADAHRLGVFCSTCSSLLYLSGHTLTTCINRLVLEVPAAGGERFIVSGGVFKWQDFIDAAHKSGVYEEAKVAQGEEGRCPRSLHSILSRR